MVTSLVEDSPSEVIETETVLPMHLATGDAGFLGERARVSPVGSVETVPPSQAAPEDLGPAAVRLGELFRDQTRRMLRDLQLAPDNPSLLNSVGLSYLSQGLVDEARQHFERAVAADPKNVQARLNLARCEVAAENVSRALSLCSALAAELPEKDAVHITLADIYGRLGRHADAVSTLSAVLGRAPQNPVALYNRGVQYLLLRQFDKAIGDFRAVVQCSVRFAAAHNSLGVCYLVTKNHKKAVRHLRIAAHLDKTPEVKKNLVAALLDGGSTVEAMELLTEHVTAFPRDWPSRELLATAHMQVGNASACLRTLFEVLRAYTETGVGGNDIARVQNNLGVAYSKLGDQERARERYEASLALSEGVAIPLHNLARQYLSQGRIQKARKLLEEHSHRFPGDALTLAMSGRVTLLLGDLDRAQQLFRQAIQVDPNSVHGYTGLSFVLGDYQGNHEEAAKVTSQALEQIPRHPMLLNNLAYHLLMAGRIREAREALDRITGHEGNVYVTATRGLLSIRGGRVQEGEGLYNRAAKLARGDLRTLVEQKKRVETARHWYACGRLDKADALLRSALSLAPKEQVYARQAAELLETVRSSGR
jgi:tetratricopeptide (TPR) repeat protein